MFEFFKRFQYSHLSCRNKQLSHTRSLIIQTKRIQLVFFLNRNPTSTGYYTLINLLAIYRWYVLTSVHTKNMFKQFVEWLRKLQKLLNIYLLILSGDHNP